MGKKMVFFDIDGTLLNSSKELPDSTREAVNQLKQNGIHVAIATGRSPLMLENILTELDLNCYVSYNGAYCVYDGKEVFKNFIHPDLVEKVTQYFATHDYPLAYESVDGIRVTKEHCYIQESFGSLHYNLPEVDPCYYKHHEVVQMLGFYDANVEDEVPKAIPELEFVRWHEFSVDILPKGGSKALGIQEMVKRLGYDMKDVYAFGDALNDLEMLKAVGVSVAMGNALDEVKAEADFITKHVDEDGIYYACKALQLI